ncbi:MAG: UDP-N-acetylglucosamine 1-carboxyvinyltransferase [Actinobacteria bacterium]|nr:UDP-N-acetylglucosamine 1-carboxyvinyltransferase [Actinomycetota bacterium]
MDRYIIRGGNRLKGSVRVSGAKNAILPAMAATVLIPGDHIIHEVPGLRDVEVMTQILRRLGVSVERLNGGRSLRINTEGLTTYEIPEELMREMRSSIFLMGALLGRAGQVRCCHPGGCAIGARDIDLHLMGLGALGARITERYGYINAEAARLEGREIYLDLPSVGATENIMMAAVLAEGTTIIRNAAKEPEIVDLQNFLVSQGARIKGGGLDVIRIDGVSELRPAEHSVMPDRIETGSFMVVAAATRGEVELENVIPEHVEAVTAKLRESGVRVELGKDRIRVRANLRPRAVDFKTLPYPGFPTDMQPQMMALMSTADGTSIISETIFENRFKAADELRRMGADVRVEGCTAVIKGVERLSGATVEAPALREGVALILAGLSAEGITVVENVHHVDRGYERLEDKLRSLGADLVRDPERATAKPKATAV